MKVALAWSSGKDAAWALHTLRQRRDVEVMTLVSTHSAEFGAGLHRTPLGVLQLQAEALDLPLVPIEIPWPCSNASYEAAWESSIPSLRQFGVEAVAFGDLFLADIRAYREELMQHLGYRTLFPLWQANTSALAQFMLRQGLRARVVCVDRLRLPQVRAGGWFDADFIQTLPPHADACGENGEFHTLVVSGPGFRHPIACAFGPEEEDEAFRFCRPRLELPI